MTYIFIDSTSLSKYESLLLEYEKTIFINSFPNSDERESFVEDIIPRIKDSDNPLIRTYCTLALDDSNTIVGGVVADWYPGCQSLEIIYIAIDQNRRGDKIGRTLLEQGIKNIREAVREEGKDVMAIFLEVDIPTEVPSGEDSMNPVDRLKVWNAWGARRIPINYTQPPLSEGKLPVSNLMLMCLEGYGTTIGETVPASLLKNFLTDFYTGLKAKDSEYLYTMCDDIDLIAEYDQVELFSLKESPHATIANSDITTHFSVLGNIGAFVPETCNAFNSYECDLMNHINQKTRPFKTKFVKLLKNVDVKMPEFYSYTSEGVTHHRLSLNTRLTADISISISMAAEYTKAVAHVTVVPSEGTAFNNLDYIKFITNFGSRQEQYHPSEPIRFVIDGQELTFEDLLKKTLKLTEGAIRIIGEGATQFDILNIKPADNIVYEKEDFNIQDFFTTRFETKSVVANTLINRMICGLILGIFDYNRMNSAEIKDTIRPIVKGAESFFVACRGHILKIEEAEDDVRYAYPKILISPYLLIPSATLAFNGLALDECDLLIDKAMRHRFSPSLNGIIQKTEMILNIDYIDNIFHYNSEQEIIREGKRQRCMDDRFSKLNTKISIVKKSMNRSSDIIMEGLLAIIAIFGVLEALSKGLHKNAVFFMMVAGLLLIEGIRWYKIRNLRDL